MTTAVANSVEFQPGAFPDLGGFRRGYAAALAQSLRDGIPVRVDGTLSGEQQAVTKRLEADARRGERSMRREVRATSRGCSLKRHFIGCMRELVGMAEKQAARDPDRFVWNRKWNQAKKGRDGANGGYKRTQKLRCQQLLEGLGIFTPARRFRNRAWRFGWDVAEHSSLSEVVDGRCHLDVGRTVISPRRRGEGLEEYLARSIVETLAEGITEGIKNEPEGITEGITEGIKTFSEGISNLCNPLAEKDMEESKNRNQVTIPVIPVIPVKQIPVIPGVSDIFGFGGQVDQPRPQNPSSDLTDSPFKTWQPPATKTQPRLAGIVDEISHGLFDVKQLSRFPHRNELLSCCETAKSELNGSSIGDPAAVMGRAMELLFATHGRKAPRGWLPVMRKLRSEATA